MSNEKPATKKVIKTIEYKRPSGSIIELKDTPEMKAFAEKNKFVAVK